MNEMPRHLAQLPATPLALGETDPRRVALLHQVERKLLWLSAWMIHNANHIRPNRDGLKVGGHQASCASCLSILTALYFSVLRPQDRVAVKPHAGPVFHADRAAVGLHQAPGDGQAQPRSLGPFGFFPQVPDLLETIEDSLPVGREHAGAGIRDRQLGVGAAVGPEASEEDRVVHNALFR